MTKGEKLRSMTDNQIAHYVVDKYRLPERDIEMRRLLLSLLARIS